MKEMNIFLDLDNTLIHALEPNEFSICPTSFSNQFNYIDMKPYYRIFERPYCQSFLDYLFSNFNVNVWTAAQSDYAMFIIKNFICNRPERKIDHIFYSYHTELGQQLYGDDNMKDLRICWDYFKLPNYYPCNTFIVDDLENVKQTNKKNCLQVEAFKVMEEKEINTDALFDEELKRIKNQLQMIKYQYENTICPLIEYNVKTKFSVPYLLSA
jgi:hypothetical protein